MASGAVDGEMATSFFIISFSKIEICVHLSPFLRIIRGILGVVSVSVVFFGGAIFQLPVFLTYPLNFLRRFIIHRRKTVTSATDNGLLDDFHLICRR